MRGEKGFSDALCGNRIVLTFVSSKINYNRNISVGTYYIIKLATRKISEPTVKSRFKLNNSDAR